MLLKFQKQNLISTSSSSSDSDHGHFDTLQLMGSKNPYIRLMMYGKIKKMISSFKEQEMNVESKNLVRGLFVRKLKDFDEE